MTPDEYKKSGEQYGPLIEKNYRDESRKDWTVTSPERAAIPPEAVQLGAMLRIADALERMADHYAPRPIALLPSHGKRAKPIKRK